eukprot:GFYU01007163.1.p1 GENE.GFYU01007163.1~~GFYU01007163.1.p1  ORF type:complete len:318 (-),score=58.25 GFYU01007163.1:87-905(-)
MSLEETEQEIERLRVKSIEQKAQVKYIERDVRSLVSPASLPQHHTYAHNRTESSRHVSHTRVQSHADRLHDLRTRSPSPTHEYSPNSSPRRVRQGQDALAYTTTSIEAGTTNRSTWSPQSQHRVSFQTDTSGDRGTTPLRTTLSQINQTMADTLAQGLLAAPQPATYMKHGPTNGTHESARATTPKALMEAHSRETAPNMSRAGLPPPPPTAHDQTVVTMMAGSADAHAEMDATLSEETGDPQVDSWYRQQLQKVRGQIDEVSMQLVKAGNK